MGRAYLQGLRAALHRWPLVLLLFAVSVLAGLSFSAAAWSWLSVSLGKSLATRTLLATLDLNVFIDLFVHHAESWHMLLLTGLALAIVFVFLGVWLNATVVVAVGEEARVGECLRRGLNLYPVYLRLWLLANFFNAATIVGAVFLGRLFVRWTADSPSEMTAYVVVAAVAGGAGVLLLLLSTVHDHARIHSTATGSGAARAYVWAAAFVGRRDRRALPLTIVLLGTGVIVWGGYQTLATLIPTTTSTGVTFSLLWGEALLLARMILRVWTFGAETELQSSDELGADLEAARASSGS